MGVDIEDEAGTKDTTARVAGSSWGQHRVNIRCQADWQDGGRSRQCDAVMDAAIDIFKT